MFVFKTAGYMNAVIYAGDTLFFGRRDFLAAAGFEPTYARVLDLLLSVSAAARRLLDYHPRRALRLFGDLTPIPPDERPAVADVGDV